MRTRRPALLLLFLAGAASALGFAPLNLWPLTFLALAWLVYRTAAAQHMRAAAAQGWVFAFGHFLVGLNWIATAFTYQDNMPAWLGWAAVALLSLYLALFPALACALAWRVAGGSRPLALVLLLAAAWMLGEWLRATLLTGFAWNPLGVVWLELPWVAPAATVVGTYGLSGLLVLVSGLLWLLVARSGVITPEVVTAAVTRSGAARAAAPGAVSGLRCARVVGLTAGMVLVTAAAMMMAPSSTVPSSTTPSVTGPAPLASSATLPSSGAHGPAHRDERGGIPFRIVQPNIDQEQKYDPHEAARNTELYARLSGAPGTIPRLLLWPEGATLRFLDVEPDARAEIATLLGPDDLLVTGGPSVILDLHGNDDVYHNSVFAMDAAATLRWRYDKAHLVPFGEYLPARDILGRIGLSRLVPGEGDFTSGPGPRTFPLPGFTSRGAQASVGVQICYEIIFSGHVVDESRRPSFIFNPSNDAWFGAWGPPQHLAQARLRAIEEGMPVLRATPNGVSAVIGPAGELIATLLGHRQGVIDGVIPESRPPTLFAELGLWASALFGALLALIGVVIRLR